MNLKKVKHRGAILIEVALCLLINVSLLLGGLEWGWYLYVRNGIAGAAGQAVQHTKGKAPENAVELYLTGMDFPSEISGAATVDISTEILGNGTKADRATVSLPISAALLFGGAPSRIILPDGATISATAYLRQSNKSNKKK